MNQDDIRLGYLKRRLLSEIDSSDLPKNYRFTRNTKNDGTDTILFEMSDSRIFQVYVRIDENEISASIVDCFFGDFSTFDSHMVETVKRICSVEISDNFTDFDKVARLRLAWMVEEVQEDRIETTGEVRELR